MTEKQIEKIRMSIKKHRAALISEKRKFGGYFDSRGRRYHISELYLLIADYKGAISYKKWFDKNFPDDIGSPILSLIWSIAYFELGNLNEAKKYTIDTASQNVYLHGLLLDKNFGRIDLYDNGYDRLEFAKSMITNCKKMASIPFLSWLSTLMDTGEYKSTFNKF